MTTVNNSIQHKLINHAPSDLINIHACLYEIDMVQDMAKSTDGSVNHYSIAEYAFLLDRVLDPLKELLDYGA